VTRDHAHENYISPISVCLLLKAGRLIKADLQCFDLDQPREEVLRVIVRLHQISVTGLYLCLTTFPIFDKVWLHIILFQCRAT
jgi:hypothetical protein